MKFTKIEFINENKPDPRIGWVYDLNMKCTRPTELCSSCVCTNMGLPMHEKNKCFQVTTLSCLLRKNFTGEWKSLHVVSITRKRMK